MPNGRLIATSSGIAASGFINFAISQLYEDKSLEDALKMFVRMLLSMSASNFQQYPKLSLNYYNLLEVLSGDHIYFLANLDIDVFIFILRTVAEGLVSVDSTISTSCCCTLDQLITFMYKKFSKQKKNKNSLEPPVSAQFLQVTETHGELFDQMLDEKRAAGVTQAFNSLMEGIERNLSNKNKDKFTQNVAVFRRDISEALRSSKDQNGVAASGDDMI
ncbi:exportin-7-A-like [Convolutriloba macropyga]|uniref:exportin-7-A-like n=1 Tax=Convolutriloba macropyga TaxID=536237 RepID=UPI003F51F483